MTLRKKFDDVAGRVCGAILPISQRYYFGTANELAVCTLSSIDLLEEISKSLLMDKIAIAGRLLSENKGIDAIIQFTLEHPALKRIIVCGQEVKGHRAGQALLSLYMNGIDRNGRIIGAIAPYPIIMSSNTDVEAFRKQIIIIDLIGETNIGRILESVA